MSAIQKLKELRDKFANDGSREFADSLLKEYADERLVQELLNNEGFQKVLESLKQDFTARMTKIVNEDPELKSIKLMFARTIGRTGTEQKIEQIINEYLEEK